MRKLASALTLFLLISFFAAAQETKPTPKTAYSPVPVRGRPRTPTRWKPTPVSIAEGQEDLPLRLCLVPCRNRRRQNH